MPLAPVETFQLHATLRDDAPDAGRAARVADPAWLLARQLQMGELTADDAGTPAAAEVWVERSRLTRFKPALPDGKPGRALATDDVPLEARLENERQPRDEPDAALAAAAAAHYLRLLAALKDRPTLRTYRADLAKTHPPLVPSGTDAVLAALARRTFDGQALFRALDKHLRPAAGKLPPKPAVAAADVKDVTAAARNLLAWYDAMTGRGLADSKAWVAERAEYQLSVAGPTRRGPDPPKRGELVLAATEQDSGTLDWYDFDVVEAATLGAAEDQGPQPPQMATFLPTPVTFHGKPAARFWELEDRAVHLAGLAAGPEDLAAMLVVAFALRYGDDFFVVPLPLPAGAILRVGALVVTDSFGQRILLRHVAAGPSGFRAFEHAVVPAAGAPEPPDARREDALVLFPAVAAPLEAEPSEVVALLRDETANVCWAVERTVIAPTGTAVDQDARAAAGLPPAAPPGATGDAELLRYVPRTAVPRNWYRLSPAEDGPADLELDPLPPLPGETPQPPPATRVLGELAGTTLAAEEVTRVAREIVRAWQYARGPDGRQYLWHGRRVRAAARQGTSPLDFDLATPVDPEAG